MAKGHDSRSEMAHARQNDGISVIFDQNSPASSRSRSHSRSSCGSSSSSSSGQFRGRSSHRRRHRSSSTSSSSRSRSCSRPRSRSHPRCHRRSSRCRCDGHYRYGRGRNHHSPPRRYRARSRSYSRSTSPDRYSSRRHFRSRSRSSSHRYRHKRAEKRVSRSPARSHRSHSRSTPSRSERCVSLSLDEKRELLQAAKINAMKILGVENLELPASVKPVLSEEVVESKWASPEPETRVRQDPEKTPSQSDEEEPDGMCSLKMSPKRKIISFSINNSVAKPTVAAPSSAKVTPRVDSYESRKPYGHWVPVKSSKARKHSLAKSH